MTNNKLNKKPRVDKTSTKKADKESKNIRNKADEKNQHHAKKDTHHKASKPHFQKSLEKKVSDQADKKNERKQNSEQFQNKKQNDKNFSLSNLSYTKNSKEERTRKGRGTAAGRGKFAGYGKLTSRKTRPGFEGGQTPWFRRIPKKGFNNIHQERYDLVNLDVLNSISNAPELITHEYLVNSGVIKNKLGQLKILANGEISKPINVKTHAISRVAEEKIIEAGGKVEIIKTDLVINEKSAKHARVFKNKKFDKEKLTSRYNLTEYKKRPRPNFDKKRNFITKKSFK